ncbi:MAG TPA: hypothetical protein VK102_08670 [Sphingobacterium sp.]|nr:hypothetical protein [Sphingobacterium sp.]
MIPYTRNSLEKIEALLTAEGYKVRYEKGNFKTGACILQDLQVIVVNKFSDMEAKIKSLILILQEISIDTSSLDEKQKTFYLSIKQTKLSI